MFDEGRKKPDDGEPQSEDERRRDERQGVGRAAAASGAGGAGLGAGAAAGIVGGDEIEEFVRERTDDAGDAVDLDEARERLDAAEDAAREASLDVFESRVAETGGELSSEVTQAAGLIGDALPPVPGAGEDEPPSAGIPDPGDIAPAGGDAPSQGGLPPIGRPPSNADTEEGDAPTSSGPPSSPAGESGGDAPATPSAPGAPSPASPAPPAASSGPGSAVPPPPSSPDPSASASDTGEDAVVDEAPARQSAPPPPPAASAQEPDEVEEPVVETPEDSPAPAQVADASVEPSSESSADQSAPSGSSSDASPADSASGSPDDSSSGVPFTPGDSTGSSSSDSSSADSSHGGEDPGGVLSYPYVYGWDDGGDWVDVAMQSDHGALYYLRYTDDGSVYLLNARGEYDRIEGENLPHLLYVGDDGVAYFSKAQHNHTVYFSLDTHGEVEWVDYHDIPGYEPPVYEDDYEYPRVVEYEYGDEPWALIEMEDGRLVKYYGEGGAYLVDEHGNETAIAGFQVPSLLYVDHDGDAYFRVFLEHEGEYRYYTIDVDGGVEYIHEHDVPGYVPPYDDDYEYPRVIDWNADEGWVIVQGEEGTYAKYFLDGDEDPVDQYGNPIYNGLLPFQGDLLYFDEHGNAWFRAGDEGNYNYFMVDHDGGIEYVDYNDIPGYEDEEPPYEGAHIPYFYDLYANPFYGDVEPDGEPTFANGVYTQTYDNGQIVVTWFQEDGPYRIRHYSEENAGGDLQLDLTYDAHNYEIVEVHYVHLVEGVDDEEEGVLPEDAPPYFEFGGEQWDNPEQQGYELTGVNENLYRFQHPETGQHISVNVLEDGSYYVNVQAPPGEPGPFVINFHVQPDGSYEAIGGTYYDEYMEQNPPVEEYDGVLPPGTPDYFGDPMWANPEADERFYLAQTDTNDDGSMHHVYITDVDGDGATDYSIDVIHYPDGRIEVTYHHPQYGHEGTLEILTADDGSYAGYDQTYISDGPEGIPEYEEVAEPGAEDAIFDAIPDNLPAYFEEERFPNPEGSEDYHYHSSDGDVHYFVSEDGSSTIRVWTNPNGNVTMAWHEAPPGEINAVSQELVVEIQANGDWETTYYSDGPAPVDEPEFEPDGYLPDGAPDYFGNPIWVNPETDPRFEFIEEATGSSYVTREYRADLDGDGTYDYRITVAEGSEGSIYVDYHNVDTGQFEMRAVVTQDASGNYTNYDLNQPNQDGEPEGVPPVDAEPEPFGGTLPDGTPDSFEFGDRVYENPVTAFGEPVDIRTYDHGNHVTYWYEDPETGERYLVNFFADGSALIGFNYQGSTPELIAEIQIDANGAYAGHEYVGGSYWHEYDEEAAGPEDDYLPEWLPADFDGWPSPTQEGFEYQYTGTGDGNQNHFYTNGEYTIMVTDYGDGTGRVLIDDLSNGQGWDTGYDLHDYGQYDVMDEYAPEPEEAAPEDEYLPDWLPNDFDGWPSPVQEGFEYQYTGSGDGNENHFYSNGQYTIMVTDYGDGTGRVLIDDLSNGQGWDTGYDLHDYGQYSLMDAYVPEEPEPEPEDDYLPDWLPNDFDGWPSPTQEGFEYQYTGSGDGNQNHFYSNSQYTIMVTDYGDGTGRVLIDDLSNGQGWDTGYDLYDYGQYSVMDAYAPEAPDLIEAEVADIEEIDEATLENLDEALPDQPEPVPAPEPDPAPEAVEQLEEAPIEEIAQVEADVQELAEPLEFNGPEAEEAAEEASVSPEEVSPVAEAVEAEPVVETPAQAEVAEVELDEPLVTLQEEELLDPDELDDDGTGL